MLGNDFFNPPDLVDQELWFAAEMTNRQFAALSLKVSYADIENELLSHDFFRNKLVAAKHLSICEVEKWLKNSWNTEKVLNENRFLIEKSNQSYAMQWAFPQAYYSTFTSLLAHFKALGYTQQSHTAVLKHFGTLVEINKFPLSISFICAGGKRNFRYCNIEKPDGISSMTFDRNNSRTVDNQICQFLKSTREINLEEKAKDYKFKNKKGHIRQKLTPQMWLQVSESIGNTTIMDLLYRKRIKANYRDIDTFSSSHFKGLEVLESLTKIVDRINFVNESYVARAIGITAYEKTISGHLLHVENETVKNRFESIKILLNNLAQF